MSPSPQAGATTAQALRLSGLVTRADLERAELLAKEQRIGLDRATVSLGLITEDQVLYLVAETHGVDLVFPNAGNVDAELLAKFPIDLLRRHGALPLIIDEGNAVIAFAEVPTPAVLAELAEPAGLPIRPVLASARRLQKILDQVLGVGVVEAPPASTQDIAGMTAFYRHLGSAFGSGAEELRFEPSVSQVRVRVRKEGVLIDERPEPAAAAAGIATRARLLADLPASTSPQTADLTAQIAGRQVALRLAILPSAAGEVVVLSRREALPPDAPIESCGLAADVLDWLRGPFCAPAGSPDGGSGLVLVVATDAGLLSVFARALLGTVDFGNSVTAISADPRLDGGGRVRIAPTGGVEAAIRTVRPTHPDVLYVDGGENSDGSDEPTCAVACANRVVFGRVDAQPEEAARALLETAPAGGRFHRALAAVVLLDLCRALCRRCSRPDTEVAGWEGALAPGGCTKCGNSGFDGIEIVAAGVRVGANVRARVVPGMPAGAPAFTGRLQARLRELVTSGRISRADALARLPGRR